jgi:hypothetical protein
VRRGWIITRSAVGWAGIITSRCRCWRCGSLSWSGDGRGGKTPAVTVGQMRAIFTELLRKHPPTAREIAEAVSRVLRRNEEARIYHWYSKTKEFPPRRIASGFT